MGEEKKKEEKKRNAEREPAGTHKRRRRNLHKGASSLTCCFQLKKSRRGGGFALPIHQSSRSRQRRFTMTPSELPPKGGRIPQSPLLGGSPSCCKTHQSAGLQNKLFNVELSKILNGRAVLPPPCSHKAPGELRWLSGLSGTAPASCQEGEG